MCQFACSNTSNDCTINEPADVVASAGSNPNQIDQFFLTGLNCEIAFGEGPFLRLAVHCCQIASHARKFIIIDGSVSAIAGHDQFPRSVKMIVMACHLYRNRFL